MGIYEGLGQIQKLQQELEARRAASENRAKWLSMKDKETVKMYFLQEFDRSATGFHEEAGLAIIATEHSNPANYRRRALCTASEGACYGCQMHSKDYKAGWGPKGTMYINALVERQDGTREVLVVKHSNSTKATLTPALLMQAVEEGTVTDRWWKMTRKGADKTTTYIPMPQAPSNDIDVADYLDQIVDLKKVAVRSVPYEEQASFYNQGNESSGEESGNNESRSSGEDPTSPDADW